MKQAEEDPRCDGQMIGCRWIDIATNREEDKRIGKAYVQRRLIRSTEIQVNCKCKIFHFYIVFED